MATLSELSELVEGKLVGDPLIEINGVSEIENSKVGTISFFHLSKYKKYLSKSKASAILVDDEKNLKGFNGIVSKNPLIALSKILNFFENSIVIKKGIHPTAIIDSTCKIDKSIYIGPYSIIEKNVQIGKNVFIDSFCQINENSIIGDNSKINSSVMIYPKSIIGNNSIIHSGTVIGCDGFGYATENDVNYKIPQIGNVIIEDDVEIGSNCVIDRGTLGSTVIGKNTKLDNLVHIAHNVKIGKGCFLTAQTAVAGSSIIEDFVSFGGRASVSGHITVGTRAKLAAKSGVTKSLAGNQTYAGMPARKISEKNKVDASLNLLPEFFDKIKELNKKIKKIEENG